MFRKIRRNLAKANNSFSMSVFTKLFSTVAIAATVSCIPAFGQEIVVDGNTGTVLNTAGVTTNVTTSTIKGSHAFNSFSKFNVSQGKIVNLHVPTNSDSLINLVHDQKTNINGILNSIKDGHVGGNVFLVNPHGVTVGTQGVVNVGSLTAVTPTKDYMDNFFDAPGQPSDASVQVLLNGNAPVNPDAEVLINGQINAIESVKLDTGRVVNNGEINTGAVYDENDVTLGDVVNINTLENAENITVNDGEIVINAQKDVISTGKMVVDGGNNLDAGNIQVHAGNNIELNEGSVISAKGAGENSDGGNVYFYAENDATFSEGAVIDVRGGEISGDGGFVEFSAKEQVNLSGGQFKAKAYDGQAGDIFIDPDIVIIDGNVPGNQLSDGGNITITAVGTINVSQNVVISSRDVADYLNADHATASSEGNSGDISLTAPNINLSNNVKVYSFADNGYTSGSITFQGDLLGDTSIASNSVLKGGDISIVDGMNVDLNMTSIISDGQVNITGSRVYLTRDDITAGGDVAIIPSQHLSLNQTSIHAAAQLTLNSGDIANEGLYFFPESGTITAASLVSDFLSEAGPIILNSSEEIVFGNTAYVVINGVPLNPSGITIFSSGESVYFGGKTNTPGDIVAESATASLYVMDDSVITAGGEVSLTSGNYMYLNQDSSIQAGTNVTIETDYETYVDDNASIQANNDIIINNADYFISYCDPATLTAGRDIIITAGDEIDIRTGTFNATRNLTLDPGAQLDIMGGNFIAGSVFTYNAPNFVSNNQRFYPDSVNAGSINSNFMANDTNVNIDSDRFFALGNLSHMTVGGALINIPNVTIDATGGAYLYGDNNVSGNVTLIGGSVNVLKTTSQTVAVNTIGGTLELNGQAPTIDDNVTVNADQVILDATSGNATIGTNASVTGTNGVTLNAPGSAAYLESNASVNSDNDITFTGNQVYLNGSNEIDAGRDINFQAPSTVQIQNDSILEADGNITLSSTGNQVQVKEGVDIDAGGFIDILALSSVEVRSNTILEAGTDISVDAGGSIDLISGQLNAGGDLSVDTPVNRLTIWENTNLDGTNIDIQAREIRVMAGTDFAAPSNVTIDALDQLDFSDASIHAGGQLTLNMGAMTTNDGTYRFVPAVGTVEAQSLDSDFLIADMNLTPPADVEIGNFDQIIINGASFVPNSITIQPSDNSGVDLVGNINAVDEIYVLASNDACIKGNANISAGNRIRLYADDNIEILANASIIAGGDFYIESQGQLITNDSVHLEATTGDLDISSESNSTIGTNNTLIAGGYGSIYSNSNQASVGSSSNIDINGDFWIMTGAYDTVRLNSNVTLDADSAYIGGGSHATIDNNVNVTANNEIEMTGGEVTLHSGSVLTAENVSLEPDDYLYLNNASITASGDLTINGGSIATNGLYFIPAAGTIRAANLDSNFLPQPGQALNITSAFNNISIGNLDHIIIGGNQLDPSSVTLYAGNSGPGYVGLYGDNHINGYIDIRAWNDAYIYNNAGISATNLTVYSQHGNAYLANNATIDITGNLLIQTNDSYTAEIKENARVIAGGTIDINAANGIAEIDYNTDVDATGTITLDGGNTYYKGDVYSATNIEQYGNYAYIYSSIQAASDYYSNANRITVEGNGKITAANVTIDPADQLNFRGSIETAGQLTINYGDIDDYGITFKPKAGSIRAGSIDSDFLPSTVNAAISIESLSDDVYVGNFDYVYINGQQLNPSSISIDANSYAVLTGKNTTSGDVTIISDVESAYIDSDSIIDAGGNINIESDQGDAYIGEYAQVNAGGDIEIYATDGEAYVYNEATVTAGNDLIIHSESDRAYIDSECIINAGQDILISSAGDDIFIDSQNKVTAGRDINLSAVGGGEDLQVDYRSELTAGQDIILIVNNGNRLEVKYESILDADNDILITAEDFEAATELERDSVFTATNNIIIDSDIIEIFESTLLDAEQNITINADLNLNFENASIDAEGTLTINAGDIEHSGYNLTFYPEAGTVEANELVSDFLSQPGEALDITVNNNLYLGNLDHIYIDGIQYNPSSITLESTSGSIELYGDISTSGDFDVLAENSVNITSDESGYNASLTAGGDFTAIATNQNLNVAPDSIINATNVTLLGQNAILSGAELINATNNIYVEAVEVFSLNNSSLTAGGQLSLQAPGYTSNSFTFIPAAGSINCGSLATNFLNPGGALTINSTADVYVGNLDYIYVNGIQVVITDIDITTTSDSLRLQGKNTVSGSINLESQGSTYLQNGVMSAGGDVNVIASSNNSNMYAYVSGATLDVGGNLTVEALVDSYSANAYITHSTVTVDGNLTLNAQTQTGNSSYAEIVGSSVVDVVEDIDVTSYAYNYSYAYIQDDSNVESDGTINIISGQNGNYGGQRSESRIDSSIVNAGVDVNVLATSKEEAYTRVINNADVDAGQDVNIISRGDDEARAYVHSYPNITAGRNINVQNLPYLEGSDDDSELYMHTNPVLNAGNDVTIESEYMSLGDNSSNYVRITAGNNVVINPSLKFLSYGLDIDAANQLTLNAGDIAISGIEFVPYAGTIKAQTLVSNFLEQGGAFNVTSNQLIRVGNLDYIVIGGNILNPSSIRLESTNSNVYLTGATTTSGDITLIGNGTTSIYEGTDINAGGNISVYSNSNTASIEQYSNVYATGNVVIDGHYTEVQNFSIIEAGGNITLENRGEIRLINGTLTAGGALVVNSPSLNLYNFTFRPDSVTANSLTSDWLTLSGPIDLVSSNYSIALGNLKNVVINGVAVVPSSISVEGGNLSLYGTVEAEGNISLTSVTNSNRAFIAEDANITSKAGSVRLIADNAAYIDGNATVNAYEDVYLQTLDSYYGDASYIGSYANVTAGRDVILESADAGSAVKQSANVQAGRDILFTDAAMDSSFDIEENAVLNAGRNIGLTNAQTNGYLIVQQHASLTAADTIDFTSDKVYLFDGSSLTANNINVTPDEYLKVQNASINATNTLVLDGGDITNNGLYFVPEAGTIQAGTLLSNFLQDGVALNLTSSSSLDIGNLDYVYIGGNQINITGMNLNVQNNNIYLYGKNTINGDINLTADYVNVNDNAQILTSGTFVSSSTGSAQINNGVSITAQNGINISANGIETYINLQDNSSLDTAGSIALTANGIGSNVQIYDADLTAAQDIEINAYGISLYDNANIDAENNVVINPTEFLFLDNASVKADNELTLNSGAMTGAYDFSFVPEAGTIEAATLVSDFLTQNGAINISTAETLYFGNIDHVLIGGNPLNPTDITLTSTDSNVELCGDISLSGNLNVQSSNFSYANSQSVIIAGGDINLAGNAGVMVRGATLQAQNISITGQDVRIYQSGEEVTYNSELIATNDVVINPTEFLRFRDSSIDAGGQLTLNCGDLRTNGIFFVPDKGSIEASSLVSDFLVQNGDMNLYLTNDDQEDISIGNLDYITIGGSSLNIQNLIIDSGYNIDIYGDITVAGNVNLDATRGEWVQINENANLIAGGDILLTGKYVKTNQNSNITAGGDLTLTPTRRLHVEGGSLNATDTLTLNTGNIDTYGIYFIPDAGTVNAGNLVADFISGNDFLINSSSSIYVGNLNHIYVGGQHLVFDNINLNSINNNVYLSGDIYATNDVTSFARNEVRIEENSNIQAGNNISLGTSSGYFDILQKTTLTAGNDILFTKTSDTDYSYLRNNSTLDAGNDIVANLTGAFYFYDDSTLLAGHNIDLTSTGYGIQFQSDTSVQAGNDINITAQNLDNGYAYFYQNSQVVAGNDINIHVNQYQASTGSSLEGKNVVINPLKRLYLYDSSITAIGQLTLNAGDYANNGLYFIPEAGTVTCATLVSDFLSPDNDLILHGGIGGGTIAIGNLDHMYVGGNPLGIQNIEITTQNGQITLLGDINVPGNIYLNSYGISGVYINQNANIVAGGSVDLITEGYIYIQQNSFIRANSLLIDPARSLDIDQTDIILNELLTLNGGNINQYGLTFRPDSIQAGTMTSDFLLQNGPLTLSPGSMSDTTVEIANLDNVTIGGNSLNTTEINISNFNSILLGGDITTGNINLQGSYISIIGGNHQQYHAGQNNISENSYVGNITADDMFVNPGKRLFVDGVDLQVSGQLTLNSGNVGDYGIVFRPYEINTNVLHSDFLTQDGPVNLSANNGNIFFANTDNVFIAGNALNPSDITLSANKDNNRQVFVSGGLSTAGNIDLNAYKVELWGINFVLGNGSIELSNDIEANNLTVDASGVLRLYKMSMNIDNQLTINAGDWKQNGLFFIPEAGTIRAQSLVSDFLVQNGDMNFVNDSWSTPDFYIGNLDHVFIGGNALNPTSLNIQNFDNVNLIGDNTVGQLTVQNIGTLVIDSELNMNLDEGAMLLAMDPEPEADDPGYTFNNDVISTITADNMIFDPAYNLKVNNVNLVANNSLTINGGDIVENGLFFNPNSITTGTLTSDFITQDAPLFINVTGNGGMRRRGVGVIGDFENNSHVVLGNLDEITVGGQALNPTNIYVHTGGYIYLVGNNSTVGELDLDGKVVKLVNNSVTTATSTNGQVSIVGQQGVVIDGTLIANGNNANEYLRVLNDGSIDPTSTIGATIENGIINVDNVAAGSGAVINIMGDLSGGGSIELNESDRSIEIVNESAFDLLLNQLGFASNTPSELTVDGQQITSDYGNISVTFNGAQTIGDIDVTSTGSTATDILLNDAITTGISNVNIYNNCGGNIENFEGSPVITAVDITLMAPGGSIGEEFSPININMVNCTLNANGLNGVYITELDGNVTVGQLSSGLGTVQLVAQNGNITAGGPSNNIDAVDAYIRAGGDIDLSMLVDNTATVIGNNIALLGSIGGNITIYGTNVNLINIGDTQLLKIDASDELMVETIAGNILQAPNSPAAAIEAPVATLIATDGSIGTAEESLIMNLSGGEIYAAALNDIYLRAFAGDLQIGMLDSLEGDVSVYANYGNIIDGTTGVSSINGNDITLFAGRGYIGTEQNPLEIDLLTSRLDAIANSGIFITETDGDLSVGKVYSYHDSVMLTAANGNIVGDPEDTPRAGGEEYVNVIAQNDITLNASNGAIGTSDNMFVIDMSLGNLTANANNDIFILSHGRRDQSTDININNIASANGDVTLYTVNGNIYGDATSGTHISARDITLVANGGAIGTAQSSVDIDMIACSLFATADNDIFINEVNGDFTIGSVQSISGDVTLEATNGNIISLESDIVNALGDSISLISNNGAVGTEENPFMINLGSGSLEVDSANDVFITESAGNMNLATVSSTNGDVQLGTLDGSILDALPGEQANITAYNVDFNVNNGTVGTASDDVNIDLLASTVSGQADSIFLTENNGNIQVDQLVAQLEILLKNLNGSISGVAGSVENIVAINSSIDANGIDLDLNTTGNAELNSTAGILVTGLFNNLTANASGNVDVLGDINGIVNGSGNNITVFDKSGNLTVGLLEAKNKIDLIANKGSILSANGSSENNLLADAVDLTALFDVGSYSKYMRAEIGNRGNMLVSYGGRIYLIVNGLAYGSVDPDPTPTPVPDVDEGVIKEAAVREAGRDIRQIDNSVIDNDIANVQNPDGPDETGFEPNHFVAVYDTADLLNDDNLMNVIKNIFDEALEAYDEAIEEGLTEEEAAFRARMLLEDANIDKQTANKLVNKKKIMEYDKEYQKEIKKFLNKVFSNRVTNAVAPTQFDADVKAVFDQAQEAYQKALDEGQPPEVANQRARAVLKEANIDKRTARRLASRIKKKDFGKDYKKEISTFVRDIYTGI